MNLQVINELRMEICHVLNDITYEKRKYHDVCMTSILPLIIIFVFVCHINRLACCKSVCSGLNNVWKNLHCLKREDDQELGIEENIIK